VTWANGTDLRQKYVGRSGCAPEFKPSLNRYGIRVDKDTGTFLEAYEFRTGTTLVLVQHRTDKDTCGTIRDVIQSQPTDRSFVWECLDKRNPSAIVVGTWPSEHPSVSGPAIEAWRIDLKQLRFYRLKVPVVCDAGNYAGPDNGDDLANLARKRTAEQKTKAHSRP
jgi:hypothetical protein